MRDMTVLVSRVVGCFHQMLRSIARQMNSMNIEHTNRFWNDLILEKSSNFPDPTQPVLHQSRNEVFCIVDAELLLEFS